MVREIILILEAMLVLTGLALLWPYALSPRAKKATAQARFGSDIRLHWNLSSSDFLLFIFCVITGGLGAQLLCAPLLKFSPSGGEDADLTLVTLFLGGAFHFGMLAGIAFFRLALRREDKADSLAPDTPFPDLSPKAKILGGAATFLMALPLVAGTGLLWQLVLRGAGLEIHEQDLVGIFANADSPLLLLAIGFLAVVVAPLTEELLFRAGIFRYLRTRTPRWLALALPALLFAALHANLASFAPLAVLGLVFALAYERSQTIAVPIIAHALFNLNTLIVILSGLSGSEGL